MKVRVEHYSGAMYVIYYRINWWSMERLLTIALVDYDEADLNERNFPKMFDNFNEAVELAKSLTPEGVRVWNAEQDEIFERRQTKLLREQRAREKRTFST